MAEAILLFYVFSQLATFLFFEIPETETYKIKNFHFADESRLYLYFFMLA